MGKYILARLIGIVPTLILLLLFVVMLVRLLPGNALDIILQEQVRGTGTERAELEKRMGLDKSVPEELLSYSLATVRGDLGKSLWSQRPVTELIGEKIGVTIKLATLSLALSTTFGIGVGILAAVKQGSLVDYFLRSFTILNLSIPNFATATLVIVLPVIWFGWSPSVIYKPQSAGLVAHYTQFLIPAIILGLAISSTNMRITRTMMLEVMRQDYIRTARAKGATERTVIFRHALQNAMIPVVSILGLQISFLVSGAVIIETVFALPGIGRLLVSSIAIRDYPVVQGITLITGTMVIVANLLVDLSYGWLDPRAKVTGSAGS